jgi:pilus assembly protein CpaB
MRILYLIFAALIVAGGTGYYVMRGLDAPVAQTETAEVQAPQSIEVFVPAVELTAGTIIGHQQLGRMPINKSSITPEMVVADEAGEKVLIGSVARQKLPRGVPIARSATVQPGDRGFLAAVLPKGKRAISIPIGEVAGISGLVLPGDRVDIILTYSLSADVINSERDIRASETVMKNLRILALDQRLGPIPQSAEEGAEPVMPPIARTATLEVTPQEAEMITLATTLGELSMVLNSVADGGEPDVANTDGSPGNRLTLVARNGPQGFSGRRVAGSPQRKMTLDSDVTSLLQRQLSANGDAVAAGTSDSAVPLPDRIIRVQIVRGTRSGGVNIEPAAPEAAPETTTTE